MSRGQLQQIVTYPAIVGSVIAQARVDANLDQGQLAQGVGVTQSTWSRIENGASALTVEQLRKAADALGIAPAELVQRADRIEREVEKRGVRVMRERVADPLSKGLLLVGAAALAALVVMILSGKGK